MHSGLSKFAITEGKGPELAAKAQNFTPNSG